MSLEINLPAIIESALSESFYELRVGTNQALEILKQNCVMNFTTGAPKALIEEHLMAMNKTVEAIRNMYAEKVLDLK